MRKLLLYLLATLLSLLFPSTENQHTPPAFANTGLTVHFIDVGQADCALVGCGEEYMLIDGGNVDDGRLVVSYLKQMGVERLSCVVCSHAHEDHAGGLSAVLAVFDTEQVYAPVEEAPADYFDDLVRYAGKQGLAITVPEPGHRFFLGDAAVTVLGPTRDYEEANNTSLILKLCYGESDFLFTGDMEIPGESDLLDHWGPDFDWNVEVLKVGHHGSETSTGYRFLYETNPDYAVISVERGNPYGHPHQEPLSRLRDAGAILFRTDRLGHIYAHTDGSTITFSWENPYAEPEDAIPADPAMKRLYGNKKTLKFHRHTCSSLPSEKNQVEFTDYDDAIAAGYSPCGSCME